MKIVPFCFYIFQLFSLVLCQAVYADSPCDSVLRDGVFQSTKINENRYLRTVFAARLATTDKGVAESKRGGGITIPIEGIPIGAEYSEEEYKSWQKSLRASWDIEEIVKHDTEILISSGDSTIVKAWSDCMRSQGGFAVRLVEKDKTNLLLKMTYYAKQGQTSPAEMISGVFVKGAKVEAGSEFLMKGEKFPHQLERTVNLARINDDPVVITCNTDVGSAEAYLPTVPTLPKPKVAYETIKRDVGIYSAVGKGANHGGALPPIELPRGYSPSKKNGDVLNNVRITAAGLGGFGKGVEYTRESINVKPAIAKWFENTNTVVINWTSSLRNQVHDLAELTGTMSVEIDTEHYTW
jgi:hypothetical protein